MSEPHFEHLDVSVDGAIARLTLNRPEKLNPLGHVTLRSITDAARWLDSLDDVKVVIVAGAGRAFSAGADLSGFKGVDLSTRREMADYGRQMADALENMRPLAIARIQGWCVGGGLVLAAACDIRVAAQNSRFSIPEVDLGIGLAWGGIPRLVREIGPAMAKELVLTCREFSPEEAKSCGFLNRVVSEDALDDEVEKLAASLAGKAAYPLSITKRHINALTDQAFGTRRTWSDADALQTALIDPECEQARQVYLHSKGR